MTRAAPAIFKTPFTTPAVSLIMCARSLLIDIEAILPCIATSAVANTSTAAVLSVTRQDLEEAGAIPAGDVATASFTAVLLDTLKD